MSLRQAQQIYDNASPPEDHDLTKAQEEIVRKVLDWASIPDFVDEISCSLFQETKKRIGEAEQKNLADEIHDLVAKALGVAI